jgi:hypothetical protein
MGLGKFRVDVSIAIGYDYERIEDLRAISSVG